MKKRIVFLLLLSLLTGQRLLTQVNEKRLDGLWQNVGKANTDSARFFANIDLYDHYAEVNRDSALWYADEAISVSRNNNKKIEEARALASRAYQLIHKGQYPAALQDLLAAFRLARDPGSEKHFWFSDSRWDPRSSRLRVLSTIHHMYAILMGNTGNGNEQIGHFKEAGRIGWEVKDSMRILLADLNLGMIYAELGKLDSALIYGKEGEQLAMQTGYKTYLGGIYAIFGRIQAQKKDTVSARQYFHRAVHSDLEQNNLTSLGFAFMGFANFYISIGHADSSLYYARKATEIARSLGVINNRNFNLGLCYEALYRSYKIRNEIDSVFKYQGLALVTKDSLYRDRIANLTAFQNLSFNEQLRLKELEEERVTERNRIRTYALLAGLAAFFVIAILLYRNNRQKQRSNKILQQTLFDLRAAQSQLIQSEKMASLGELTAGIAHEIQNPLNFVNNFSDVNKELVEELYAERLKPVAERNQQLENELLATIRENEEKINHHGKRAESIVKGMLQHSRISSGQKEPTDINALADEFLRLAYHGARAKDKSFNAITKTEFDDSIGKVNVVPQDIGRVILNLINNAFYAVSEKQKRSLNEYEPVVTVSTRSVKPQPAGGGLGAVEVRVRDNGNGIPQKNLDKIFQPFFTTKPTGQGTGLGLSLAYDIITKGHNGEIRVNSKEREGTEFTIILPG